MHPIPGHFFLVIITMCSVWAGQHVPGLLPPMSTRKSCVKNMNRPDSPPPPHTRTHTPCRLWTLPPFRHWFTHRNPANPARRSSLRDSCGTLVNRNSSQPGGVTGSRSAVTVGVWMSGLLCETEQWKTQEVGQAWWCWEKSCLGQRGRDKTPFYTWRFGFKS